MYTRKSHIILFLSVVVILVITAGCSVQKNTAKTRFWHSFTANYNTYYNGAVAYVDASTERERGNKDNFTELLPLYTVGNKESRNLGSANYERAIEKSKKAIQLHSIKKRPEWNSTRRKTEKDIEWLSRREYNPFLWKAWMLMGRSQFHKGDFEDAASTFAHMSRLYRTQPAIYGKARAWLAKCYVELGWDYDAEDVITNINRDSIHWKAQKEWDYTMADYYLHRGETQKAIEKMRRVVKHEMRSKQKAREWYIIGQLEASVGHSQEAYKAFRSVLRLFPPYELELNARIAMTEVMAKGQGRKMVSKLRRMAANDNNKDYLDQIYYAIGNIQLSEKDTLGAISSYEKGVEKGTRSGIEKGVLLLHLGDIYWEREQYADARRCYNSALGMLDKERDDYEQLSYRSKVLDELVPFTDAIHLQDSLQYLASCPEKERNEAIDRVITALKKKEKEEKRAQAEQDVQNNMAQGNNAVANRNNPNAANPMRNMNNNQQSTFYFYNPDAVAQGKATFEKQWGKRKNADDWQRSNKTVVDLAPPADEGTDDSGYDDGMQQGESTDSISGDKEKLKPEEDPHQREYYLAQIPFTTEQKAESDSIIVESLFNSGVIFKDKLDNLPLAAKSFDRLVKMKPDYSGMDDVLYHLYLLNGRKGDMTVANGYLAKMKEKYPESKWTKLLSDPYYRENTLFGAHMEDSLYVATYEAFRTDRLSEVSRNVTMSEERFPEGANRDKFVFIGGLSKLNGGDASGCLEDMNTVVTKYPQSSVAEMAGMIINGVKAGRKLRGGKFTVGDVWTRRADVLADNDSIQQKNLTAERDVPFAFVTVYHPDSLNENQMLYDLAKFNFTSYLVRSFDIEITDIGGLHQMQVSGFRSFDEAHQYAHQLYQNKAFRSDAEKARSLIVSMSNLQLLGTSFSYADYEKFYEKHFGSLKLPAVQLLTEPVEIAEPKESDRGGNADDDGYNIDEEQGGQSSTMELDLPSVDEELTPKTEDDNLIVAPSEPTVNGASSTEDNGALIVAPAEPSNNGAAPSAEDNGALIIAPVTPEAPSTEDEDDGTFGVPEYKEVIDDSPSEFSVPVESPSQNNTNTPASSLNEFTVPAENSPVTSSDIIVSEKEEKPAEVRKPATETFVVTEKEENTRKEQPLPKKKEDDAPEIFFDDGFGTGTYNSSQPSKQKEKPSSIDLEDEYYDLDGF